jgi:integrase
MSKIFLDAAQIKKMYDIAGSRSIRDEVLLRIMGNTGLRVSDAKSLLIEDVVDRNGNVYTSIRRKMKKTGSYVERSINDTTRERIIKYLPTVVGTSKYLFPGLDPSKPIGRTYCHELFKYILSKLMPQGTDSSAASTHTLRRSVAMLLASATSIQVASSFLGHKSIASTTSYLSQEILGKEAREFLDKNLDF